MKEKIESILEEIKSFQAESKDQAEEFRLQLLSKKGKISLLFEEFRTVPAELKKEMGQRLNELRDKAQARLDEFKLRFEDPTDGSTGLKDLTLPGTNESTGTRHPLSIIRNQITEIFSRIGFTVADGPEIEDDWHNFSALNFAPNHPARDMQDTFFITPEMALRTHTSSVQVRLMESQAPPLRAIMPGRVYRNEAISARAHCFFHQVEGLYVDKGVSFADLKQCMLYFAREMFGEKTEIRLRPSYFPFTEPSAEMDISCNFCEGKGCSICKHSGWVEILGCGMVDPQVLENCKIDSKQYSGFAFGMGIERITMLRYQVKDLRLFSENDMRFLSQFKSAL
ncbi:MAG TPA: phenylalanine--tRNA ligase subunit alpha [Bacteroidia bacterium]|jgi:phenylalanyl-tRNA synthetase alpha chain|nr:phenylalanine--tRNA ligase subunit alpha [Bacteroidia bacterium]